VRVRGDGGIEAGDGLVLDECCFLFLLLVVMLVVRIGGYKPSA
jgi:hypothetical protein